jgi:hypothetical protein
MLEAKAANTEMFIAGLYADPDLQTVLAGIPECFIEQARDAYDQFFVDTSLMSRSQFAPEDGSCDLIRIVLEDPFYDENTEKVSVKVRLSGVMNPDGSMQPATTGKTLTKGQQWIKGLRSLPIEFSQESVDNGVISQSDFESLIRYAELWEEYEEDFGRGCMYTTEHSSKRLWVVAANPDGIVTFDMVLRLNPQTKKPAVGLSNVAWADCKLIGSTVGVAKQAAVKAGAPTARKSQVDLPAVNRGATKVVTSGRRRR